VYDEARLGIPLYYLVADATGSVNAQGILLGHAAYQIAISHLLGFVMKFVAIGS
jgi:hypothetical protein